MYVKREYGVVRWIGLGGLEAWDEVRWHQCCRYGNSREPQTWRFGLGAGSLH